jgi:DNA mismatch repair protein MutS2
MDAHTLQILEFTKVRELLAGFAATSLGRELANAIEPSTDELQIRHAHELVTKMCLALGQGHVPPFAGLSDVRLLVRRAMIGAMLTADQLLEVASVFAVTGGFYRYKMRLDERCGRLIEMLQPIEDLGPAAKSITSCIDPRGVVVDSASPELSEVRRQLHDLEERVKSALRRMLNDPETRSVLRYQNATMSGDHYVLPVATNYRHKLPGVVHRTSPTGETMFIEPAALANLGADRAVLKGDEDKETKKILRRLTGEVGRLAKPLNVALDILARLDLITAKAKLSRALAMTAPVMNLEGRLAIRIGRHVLLESIFRQQTEADGQPRAVVPIDVTLGYAYNLLVITGPNTGGKTVALKTVGLFALMAQAGMHVPGEQGTNLPIFDQILADIGDEQSLEQSLSTFSSHMSRISAIFRSATDKSLVLLDELGAGTDPTEGAALGRAILDQLDRVGCRAIVTTHIGDLKTYAMSNSRAENAAVEFDAATLQPTYRVLIGQFGMSNALTIARRLKLPAELISQAYRYLNRRRRRNPELVKLHKIHEEAEKARAGAVAAKLEVERDRQELEKEREELRRQTHTETAQKAARERLQVGDEVHVARFGKVGRVIRVDVRKRLVQVAVGLGQWEVPLDECDPAADATLKSPE